MSVHALHGDCVVCLANENGCTVESHTRTLLLMFMTGTEVEGVVRDLCFLHRRNMGDAFERYLEEGPGPIAG